MFYYVLLADIRNKIHFFSGHIIDFNSWSFKIVSFVFHVRIDDGIDLDGCHHVRCDIFVGELYYDFDARRERFYLIER